MEAASRTKPALFVRSKWHTKERNVTVDSVWVADQNALRGQYRLGRVIKVKADPNVRDVVDVRDFDLIWRQIWKRSQKVKELKSHRPFFIEMFGGLFC